ncbi:tail protein (modular protein) [Escherichia coli]|nr:tail protein (modular protein) [Escherichia coli]
MISIRRHKNTDRWTRFPSSRTSPEKRRFVGLQTLVAAAGSGELQKLTRELQGARGEADRVAKVMADNLDGDLKNLDSAWEGLRIRISDLVDGPLRSVTQWLTRVLEKNHLAGAGPSGTDAPATDSRRCVAGNDCNGWLVVAGYWCACWPAGKTASWLFPPDRFNECCQTPASTMGNGDGFRFVTGGRYRGVVQSGRPYRGCACRSCRSHLEILDPIRAFFAGVFSGIMERLTPLRETFERFGPVFDAIGSGISQVFNWFKSLLSPMESSKETLDKCTSAGEIFGNVLGGALQLVLTPAKMLLDTLAWILEKLGVLPDEAERARKKIEDAQRAAILQDKVALLQGDLAKINPPKLWKMAMAPEVITPKTINRSQTAIPVRCADSAKLLITQVSWLRRRKNALAPAILSLKNLPRALAVRGSGRSGRLRRSVSLPPQLISHPWSGSAASGAGPCCCGQLPPGGGGYTISSGISSCNFP